MNYFNPTKIVSGKACFKNYDDVKTYGSKCIIVTGKTSAKKCGALDDAIALFQKNNIDYIIFDEIEPNPLIDTCQRAGLEAYKFGAEFVLGIGGGSALDASKAIAIYATNPEMDKLDIYHNNWNMPIPLLAVNTTVGTGSEVTPYSVLTVHEFKTKKSVGHPSLFPQVAFLDPDYVKSLPKSVKASTAVDALSHAIEGYLSKKTTLMTDIYAEAAIKKIVSGLNAIAQDKIDDDVNCELLYGSTLAGLVIAGTGTCFVHSMGYPLTYIHGAPHGEANAYFLMDFIDRMESANPERVKKLLECCMVTCTKELHDLIYQILPMQIRLTDEQCREYAKSIMDSKNLLNAIKLLSEDEIYDMYKNNMM